MNNIYNVFLELYKIPIIKTAINIIVICLALIVCYRLGHIIGTTINNIDSLFSSL